MRLAVLVLLLGAVGAAIAATTTTTCLRGEIPLVLGVDAPAREWCSRADCTLQWRLDFDATRVSLQRWPFDAWVNGTRLSSLYPTLVDAAIQCSSAGEMIVTTGSGPNGERVRLVWTYSGASSFSCEFMLSTVDWRTDFRQFQALLSYSGHIAAFDATASSQSVTESLDELRTPCQSVTSGGHTPPPPVDASSSSSSSSTTSDGDGGETCVVGACRRSVAGWVARPRDIAWRTVAELKFCSFSLADVMFERRATMDLPLHRRSAIQRLGAAYINAGMYGCPLDEQFDDILADLVNPLHCTLNTPHVAAEHALDEYNDHDDDCKTVDEETTHSVGVNVVSTKKAKGYLAWAITMTVLFAVVIGLLAVTLMCTYPYLMQLASGWFSVANRSGLSTLKDEIGAPPRPSFIASFLGVSPYADDGTEPMQQTQLMVSTAQPPPQEHVGVAIAPAVSAPPPSASFGPYASATTPEQVLRYFGSPAAMIANVQIQPPRYGYDT